MIGQLFTGEVQMQCLYQQRRASGGHSPVRMILATFTVVLAFATAFVGFDCPNFHDLAVAYVAVRAVELANLFLRK